MRGYLLALLVIVLGSIVFMSELAASDQKRANSARKADDQTWTSDFSMEKPDLSPTGRNPYFILEPGYTQTFDGDGEHLIITVLDQTKTIDSVETRIVEERETKNGKLIEVSRTISPSANAQPASTILAKTSICTGTTKSSITKVRGWQVSTVQSSDW